MSWNSVCEHCGVDTVTGPVGTRTVGGKKLQLCDVCMFDLLGEGSVVDCRECGKRKGVNTLEKDRLLAVQLCFTCDFWRGYERVKDDPRVVRVGGDHYFVEPDSTSWPLGFGGRRWSVEFFDGRRVVTKNLWHQGTIPEHFRERLPDNARFVSDHVAESTAA